MEDKSFIVTIKVKMSGEMPSEIDGDVIADAIADSVCLDTQFAFGEDGMYEYYIGENGEAKVEATEYSITYDDNPSCEHCGDRHSTYAATINIDGINWCTNCANCDDNFSEKEIDEILKQEKKGLKKYYKQKLKELDD